VLSKVVVLKGESRDEYEKLLTGLRETLQPEGTLEELLVEKLAALAWRHRRLLLAESAEIRKNMEFVESDQRDREREEAERVARSMDSLNNHGLIGKIHNPDVLERCLELLVGLREQVEKDGFNSEYNRPILEKIYGDRDENRLREDLYDSYEMWLDTSEVPEEERVREGYASPEQCRKNILQEIDAEIRRLKRDQKARASVQTIRTQLEIVCRNVPDGPGLDRLLRYEASLERSFDRALSQLERLQRTRLGQPVLPKLEVRHSLS
jgi:ATP-dependent Lon protease